MAVDYDLVVLGGGEDALNLAASAARLQARVALVVGPGWTPWLDLQQVALRLRSGGSDRRKDVLKGNISFAEFVRQVMQAVNPSDRRNVLLSSGVDVIPETGQFSSPRVLRVGDRELTSRTFAIVPGAATPLRRIVGWEAANDDLLTYERLLQLARLPDVMAIVGSDSLSCAIAQSLARLGVRVLLFADGDCVLPHTDVEVARHLQALLELDGIEVYTSARITALERHGDRWKLWAADRSFICDRILLPATPPDLQLAAARVKLAGTMPTANARCQTSNPRIYVCRNRSDIQTILENVLFFPSAARRSPPLLEVTCTDWEVASIGMTEIAARLQYGNALQVARLAIPDRAVAKLLCHRRRLVGAHAIGEGARAFGECAALVMHAGLAVSQFQNTALTVPCLFTEAIAAWEAEKPAKNRQRQFWLESWFEWRRIWNF